MILWVMRLNNELFYARVISNTVFDLYTKPIDFSQIPNYPLIATSAYISDGFTIKSLY